MRTREEIMQDIEPGVGEVMYRGYFEQRVIIELLLDIREKLDYPSN